KRLHRPRSWWYGRSRWRGTIARTRQALGSAPQTAQRATPLPATGAASLLSEASPGGGHFALRTLRGLLGLPGVGCRVEGPYQTAADAGRLQTAHRTSAWRLIQTHPLVPLAAA